MVILFTLIFSNLHMKSEVTAKGTKDDKSRSPSSHGNQSQQV